MSQHRGRKRPPSRKLVGIGRPKYGTRSIEHLLKVRDAGLQGNYAGTCIVCLRPTDTGIGFVGTGRWQMVGLYKLGIRQPEINDMLAALPEFANASSIDDERFTFYYRVCQACGDKADLPVALMLPDHTIPAMIQPAD